MKQQPFNRTKRLKRKEKCQVCGREKPLTELVMGSLVRSSVAALIRKKDPDWTNESYICLEDLHRFRMQHVQEVVTDELGELSDLEKRVLFSMEKHSLIAEEVIGEYEGKLSIGDWMADRIASFGGSWKFIGLFLTILISWLLVNTLLLMARPFDPYPFILLNLVLSCLAAIQAPVIMMSQNRQEQKDRARAEHDYQVNLKAELEIRQLHEKMDHVLTHQWQRIVEIQQIQTELIDELVDWHEARGSLGDE
ncbi:MAG: DUF1003 domain-containing protein [bacterium]